MAQVPRLLTRARYGGFPQVSYPCPRQASSRYQNASASYWALVDTILLKEDCRKAFNVAKVSKQSSTGIGDCTIVQHRARILASYQHIKAVMPFISASWRESIIGKLALSKLRDGQGGTKHRFGHDIFQEHTVCQSLDRLVI